MTRPTESTVVPLGDGHRLVHFTQEPEKFMLTNNGGAAWVTVWLTREQLREIARFVAELEGS